MQLRSPFDVSPASRNWQGTSTSLPSHGHRAPGPSRALAMARQHPEELGVVLRLVAVMGFFALLGTLLFWFAR